jgi:serine/threonine protein kinase
MESVDGSTLATLRVQQTERVLTWNYLEPLTRQLCDALEYAHGEGIVHRDLKPANLMVDHAGRLKLADFGIARAVTDTMSRCSITQTSGTLLYMSPQQLEGGLPKRTDDVYGVGACLYELLTSKPPFHTGDLLHQVRNKNPAPMPERLVEFGLKNDIPRYVCDLVLACLNKDERKRPGSAREVLEWLDARGNPAQSTAPPNPIRLYLDKAQALLKQSNWWFVGGGAAALLLGITSWAMRSPSPDTVAARRRETTQSVATATPARTPIVFMGKPPLTNGDGSARRPRTPAAPPVTPLPPRATNSVAAATPAVTAPAPATPPESSPAPPVTPPEVSVAATPVVPPAPAPAPTRPATAPPVRPASPPRQPTVLDLVSKGNSHVPEIAKNKILRAEAARFQVGTVPQRWRLTYYDPNAQYDAIELRFEKGQMARLHEPTRLLGVLNPQAPKPMDIEKIKIDSDEAVRIAVGLPTVASLSIKTLELELERGTGGVPVWKVRLFSIGQLEGSVNIAADDGKILKDINYKK